MTSILLVGCSKSNELRTPGQATSFIVDVSHGGKPADWRLASGASGEAARAWAERDAIRDFGSRLRHMKAAWVCEFAEGAVQIGVGKFTTADRIVVPEIARRKGAKSSEIKPLLADVIKISNPDLKKATTAVCG